MPWLLYPSERPGTHCTEGWVGLRASLDGCGKFISLSFEPETVHPIASGLIDHALLVTLHLCRVIILFDICHLLFIFACL